MLTSQSSRGRSATDPSFASSGLRWQAVGVTGGYPQCADRAVARRRVVSGTGPRMDHAKGHSKDRSAGPSAFRCAEIASPPLPCYEAGVNPTNRLWRRGGTGLGGLLLAVHFLMQCTPTDDVVPACGEGESDCPAAPVVPATPDLGMDSVTDGAATDEEEARRKDGGTSCPSFAKATSPGSVSGGALTEASGLVAGRRNPGTLWTHNDSGAGPRLYALSTTGAAVATYDLAGAMAQDWEDIAIGPGPSAGTSYLYVGDIGDNSTSRANVQVYRVAEPDVRGTSPGTPISLSGVERLTLTYPDRAHNAETLMIDPRSGDLYIVAKSSDGVSPVFRAAAPLSATAANKMQRIAVLRFGTGALSGDRKTTGGDISPRGDEIVVRTYDSAFLWRRASGGTVADALLGTPCSLPLASEPQGEALGFAADGGGYYTLSEGSKQPLYFYARR